jgi:hypothetical protein
MARLQVALEFSRFQLRRYAIPHMYRGKMTQLANIFHRRSLTFASVALVFGLVAIARVFNFPWTAHQQGHDFVQHSLLLCTASFMVCIAALVNLVLDVRRGYAPGRCSLASVIMLAAFTGRSMLAFTLASYYSR